MRLSGRLMAIDSSHTNTIFNITLRRVLFRPNFIGYLRLRYRSTLMVHRCIMLAVQNSTSRHIHARQYTGANGNSPGKTNKRRPLLYAVHKWNETTRSAEKTKRFRGTRRIRRNRLYFENKRVQVRLGYRTTNWRPGTPGAFTAGTKTRR